MSLILAPLSASSCSFNDARLPNESNERNNGCFFFCSLYLASNCIISVLNAWIVSGCFRNILSGSTPLCLNILLSKAYSVSQITPAPSGFFSNQFLRIPSMKKVLPVLSSPANIVVLLSAKPPV